LLDVLSVCLVAVNGITDEHDTNEVIREARPFTVDSQMAAG